MKSSVQWNPVTAEKISPRTWDRKTSRPAHNPLSYRDSFSYESHFYLVCVCAEGGGGGGAEGGAWEWEWKANSIV